MDRRARRTRQWLGDALIALILEKGYEAVTIKDVTERADVAYATFFRHYRDLDELLAERLTTSLESLIGQIEAAAEAGEPPEMEGRLIFQHVDANRKLYQILVSSSGAVNVRRQVREAIAAVWLRNCEPLYDGVIPAEVAANHIASSVIALIAWWLEHEAPYPVERMAQIYQRLIIEATLKALAVEPA